LNQYGVDDENEEGHATIPNGWDYWYGLVGNSVYYNYDIIEGIPKFHPMSTESNRKMQQHAVVRHRHNNTYPDDYLPLVLRNYTLEMLEKLYGPPRHVDDQDDDDDHTPFLMTVAWPTPHGPFTPEPKNEHTMDDIEAPITPNYNASSVYNHQKHWLLRQLHPISLETSRKINHHYKSRLEALKTVDEHVRDLILKLDELDLLDDTYVIYTSDNGFQFGQHRLAIDKVSTVDQVFLPQTFVCRFRFVMVLHLHSSLPPLALEFYSATSMSMISVCHSSYAAQVLLPTQHHID
jgi:N-acetylglucosamine-6-sulfatase